MADAALLLEGRHDFAAFGSPMVYSDAENDDVPGSVHRGSTERTMFAARCWRKSRFVQFCFIADAFLRHMVRMLVGTLLRIGQGSCVQSVICRLLQGDRSLQAGPAAPAHGLYLVRVRY
jgi:tRNA pseudouridine38-40 synthase